MDDEEEGEEQIQLRDKGFKSIQPILDELIRTEQTYVNNLCLGIRNYGDIFDRADLPRGLRGKRYVLLGNIEQIVEFHRDEFLPMLLRNRNDLKSIFDEFKQFIMVRNRCKIFIKIILIKGLPTSCRIIAFMAMCYLP